MKTRLLIILVGLSVLLFSSCAKAPFPESNQGLPQLKLQGSIIIDNAAPLSYNAISGVGESYSNSYYYDSLINDTIARFFVFEIFEIDDDKNPVTSLKIILNNHDVKPGSPLDDLNKTLNNVINFAASPKESEFRFRPNEARIYFTYHAINSNPSTSLEVLNAGNKILVSDIQPYSFNGKNFLKCNINFTCTGRENSSDKKYTLENITGMIAFAY